MITHVGDVADIADDVRRRVTRLHGNYQE